jgi:hypothetical protein
MARCQDLFKYWRYLMMVTVGFNQDLAEIARTNAEIVKNALGKSVSKYCVKYFEEGVEEYIKSLPDREKGWLAVLARMAHRIDYEYRKYGVIKSDWDEWS